MFHVKQDKSAGPTTLSAEPAMKRYLVDGRDLTAGHAAVRQVIENGELAPPLVDQGAASAAAGDRNALPPRHPLRRILGLLTGAKRAAGG